MKPTISNSNQVGQLSTDEIIRINRLSVEVIDEIQKGSAADVEKIRALYDQGARPETILKNSLGTVARTALKNSNIEVYDYLVEERGFTVDKTDLSMAVAINSYEKVDHLLSKYAKQFSFDDLEKVKNTELLFGNYTMATRIGEAQNQLITTQEVVSCISPNPELTARWKDTDDPAIYFSFHLPSRLSFVDKLSQKAEATVRRIIDENKDVLEFPLKEENLSDEEDAGLVQGKSPKRMIFIGTDAKSFKDKMADGYAMKYFQRNEGVKYKIVLLPEEILVNETLATKASYVTLHELFGHGFGNLKHPISYHKTDIGPFCDNNIRTENTIMSYSSRNDDDCRKRNAALSRKDLFPSLDGYLSQDCSQTFSHKLQPADIAAINKEVTTGGTFANSANLGEGHHVELVQSQVPPREIRLNQYNNPIALSGVIALAGVVVHNLVKLLAGKAGAKTEDPKSR